MILGLGKERNEANNKLDHATQKLLKTFKDDVFKLKDFDPYGFKLSDCPPAQVLLDATEQQQIQIVIYGASIFPNAPHGYSTKVRKASLALQFVRSLLLRRKLPYTEQDIIALAQLVDADGYFFNDTAILLALEKYHKAHALPDAAKSHLKKFLDAEKLDCAENRKAEQRIAAMINVVTDTIPMVAGEAWADTAIQTIQQLESDAKAAWCELLNHAAIASGGKPTKTWDKQADALLENIVNDQFEQFVSQWFMLTDKPHTKILERTNPYMPDPMLMLNARNCDILKGLVWCAILRHNKQVIRSVTQLTLSAYKKVPGTGPRAVALGNACIYALGNIPGLDALGQLALLKVKVKFGTAQKLIDKAFNTAAEREQLPRDQIEEMAVPAYGLTDVGIYQEQLGDFAAQLTVTGTTSTLLQWIKPDGKVQKSVPASVKENHAEELKEIKAAAKDIQKMLPAQRDRIDNLFLEQKSWAYITWQERYLNHPVVGTLARRIIWTLKNGANTTPVMWLNDQLVDVNAKPVSIHAHNDTVSLWHPIESNTDTIVQWREFLHEHQIQQPFKQAHREVYLLTDAERQTNVYSNRYASHIIKQHQFNALCGIRGWKNRLRLMVDDSYPPAHRLLEKWNLRAEFWIEGVGEEYGSDTTESGTYLYLATDQVRFYPIESQTLHAHAGGGGYGWGAWRGEAEPTPIALDQIPPIVLSEILRDVDLFVGVASVGNDPNWQDGGPEGRHVNYWQSYSFGDLSETAKTRKQILQRLIPRLKIAKQCHFDDKFLIVKGSIRTYKIHMMSGNILMEPNDQYLCIVPQSSMTNKATEKVFLPFEGDRVMAIILSKALMLADDKKIKDKTIISQIKH